MYVYKKEISYMFEYTLVWSEYERACIRLLHFKEDLCQDILLGRFCITSGALMEHFLQALLRRL